MKMLTAIIGIACILFGMWLLITWRSPVYRDAKVVDVTDSTDSIEEQTEVYETVFGLKVKPFGKQYYCIVFTEDNWVTQETIKNPIDLTMFGDPTAVKAHPWLFDEESSAISVAKTFSSYQSCIDHNEQAERTVRKLLAKYKEKPPVNQYPEKIVPQRETIIR